MTNRTNRLSKRQKRRAKKAANSLPTRLQHAAFSLHTNRPQPTRGTFGAASPVRRIDPATGEAIPAQIDGARR